MVLSSLFPQARAVRSALLAAVALTGVTAAGGCKKLGDLTVDVSFEGQSLTTCVVKRVHELTPEGGGYVYGCEGGTSLYFMQDTSHANDGTLISLDFKGRSLAAAVYASTRGTIDCPSAKALGRTTGEPPIPPATPGTWTLEMADPCGTVTVTVTRAK